MALHSNQTLVRMVWQLNAGANSTWKAGKSRRPVEACSIKKLHVCTCASLGTQPSPITWEGWERHGPVQWGIVIIKRNMIEKNDRSDINPDPEKINSKY